ncbi:MAG: class I SAM-dependent methyltransferase [Ignavibacteria bacterium]
MNSEGSVDSPYVNLDNPKQDVHKKRIVSGNLFRYRLALSVLPTNLEGIDILELGGGTGELTRGLVQRGANVTFIDLNEFNLENAKSLGVSVKKLDLNFGCNGIESSRYDIVVMLEVIEHIVRAEFLLSEVSRVLKNNGKLIISTPNFNFFLNRIRIVMGKLSSDEGYHYRFFNRNSLKEKLFNSGFVIIKELNNTPAIGLNFFVNRLLKRQRIHVVVPNFISNLLAQTLFVLAEKTKV